MQSGNFVFNSYLNNFRHKVVSNLQLIICVWLFSDSNICLSEFIDTRSYVWTKFATYGGMYIT
jgi:hypothetical protein